MSAAPCATSPSCTSRWPRSAAWRSPSTSQAGPQLTGNRQLVVQAVANLIENAIKYSAQARRTRGAARRSPSICTIGAEAIEIAVADNGPGIAPEDRERVLKRFVRLEKSRTEPGTGLGLSLVQAVGRLHGGAVRLEDNRPGLRVVLTLPKRAETAKREAPQAQRGEAATMAAQEAARSTALSSSA